MSYDLPTRYSAITIGQYVDWHKATNMVEQVAAALSISKDQAGQIKAYDSKRIVELFAEVLGNEESFHQKTIMINEVEYGFEPAMEEMSTGAYVDADTLNTEIFANKNYDFIPNFIGIFYRPIVSKFGKDYKIEPYDSSKVDIELMRSLSISLFGGMLAFFLTLETELLSVSTGFLTETLSELRKDN